MPSNEIPAALAPLAGLQGQPPPAPPWFEQALADAPERSFIDVQGAAIELLCWGTRGRPGLLLLHGNGAHADWWSFVAPLLAQDRRVAAISWSGMGRSQWRPRYSLALFVEEMLAAIDAAGLADAGPPIVVAHSFGGYPTMTFAARHGERLQGAVIVDTPLWSAERQAGRESIRKAREGRGPTRIYPSLEEAVERFRFVPPQPVAGLYIVDHIARQALRRVERDPSDPAADEGWTWCFDPFQWRDYDQGDPHREFAAARCPLAYLYGERSSLVSADVVAHVREHAPPGTPFIAVPDADHHVMLDQPLAFVALMRGLLTGWPRG